ncbi:hypothetical protein EJB05_53517, partial [Eragrostis curvula]
MSPLLSPTHTLTPQTLTTPPSCRHESPPSRLAAQSQIGINVPGDPSVQLMPHFTSKCAIESSTTYPKFSPRSDLKVYYTFPEGFTEIIYESTRNAMPPLTKRVFEEPPRGRSRHEDSEQQLLRQVCCNLSKWYVDGGAVSTRLWFVVALLKFAKDRFVERQPRTTAQSTGLIMVDLVKYYAVFPVLPAFMEWGRKGYFQTQVTEGYSSQGARGVYCFRGTGSRETLAGMLAGWEAL